MLSLCHVTSESAAPCRRSAADLRSPCAGVAPTSRARRASAAAARIDRKFRGRRRRNGPARQADRRAECRASTIRWRRIRRRSCGVGGSALRLAPAAPIVEFVDQSGERFRQSMCATALSALEYLDAKTNSGRARRSISVADDLASERRQRHQVRLAGLHPVRGYGPQRGAGIIEVVQFVDRHAATSPGLCPSKIIVLSAATVPDPRLVGFERAPQRADLADRSGCGSCPCPRGAASWCRASG